MTTQALTQNDSSKTSSSDSNSLSESALDTVLDKYSEDAKRRIKISNHLKG